MFVRGDDANQRPLEAIRPNGKAHQVLRERLLLRDEWDISPDGSKICFGTKPINFQVWASVREVRNYLFSMDYNGKPEVVLKPYGKNADPGFYDYTSPTWSADGTKILYSEGVPEDWSYASWLQLFQVKSRRKIWNSKELEATLSGFTTDTQYFHKQLFGAKISPNGKHIVCFANTAVRLGGEADNSQTDRDTYLLHFDLVEGKVEILRRFDLKSYPEIPPHSYYASVPFLSWSPDNLHFAFSLHIKDKNPNSEIFVGNWKTQEIRRLTVHPALDSDPVWINDGKQIVWLSNRVPKTKPTNRMFIMNADGTHQLPLLPRLGALHNLRYAEKLPNWSRYKKNYTAPSVSSK